MRRARVISVIIIVNLILFLFACSRKAELRAEEKKTLVMWHYWEQSYARQVFRQLVNQFNEENQDVEIQLKYVPDEDMKKQLALSMAEGSMPDITVIDSSDVQYFYETGYLEDVSALVDQDAYWGQALAPCLSKDGSLSGIPLGCNCLLFFYNADLLDAAGIEPPKTLEEFSEAARRLTGNGIYGCAFPALQSEESLFCFLPILWAKEGSVRALDSVASQNAFDFLRQLSVSGAMSYETVNMTLSDVEREFKKGKVAMMFTTSMSIRDLESAETGFRVGIARLPLAPKKFSIVGGEVLAVTKGKYKEEAFRFFQFISRPEQMKAYMDDMGYLAPREDILEWQLERNPGMKVYSDLIKTSRTREYHAAWPQISFAVAGTISKVILQEDSPETFTELADRIREIREGME